MADNNARNVSDAFARIAASLQTQATTKTTPYEQTVKARSTTNVPTYEYRQDKDAALEKYKGFGDQYDSRGLGEQVLNVPRRALGAVGEMVEQVAGGIVNLAGNLNSSGVQDTAKTAFYKLQDQSNNSKYQSELDYLTKNPTHAITSGNVLDQRELEERKAYLTNRLKQNQLTQDEYNSLYNPDGSETHAKQLLNWSKGAEDFGKRVTGERDKGTTGFLNAGNWYNHEGQQAYAAHKKWNGTSQNANKKLTRDAQDAYDRGDYTEWASKHLQAFGNASKESGKALLDNPMYALEETAAMLPYILPQTRAVAVAADTARVQNQSHDAFTERELRTPTVGESLGILGMTAAYTGLNYAEAVIGAGALKGKGALTSLGVKGRSSVTSAAEQSIINSVRNNAFAKATGRIGSTMVGEGLTEAGQQQIESKWGSLDPTLDSQGMGEAFTMGAVIGGTLGGPGNIANAGIETAVKAKANAVEKQMKANPEMDPRNTTEELSNPESPKFNAEAATVRMTQEASEASPEKVAEIKQNYESMVSKLQASQETLSAVVDLYDDRPAYDEYKAEQEAVLAYANQVGDNELVASTQVELGRLQAIYDAQTELLKTMDEAGIRKKYADDQVMLEKAEKALSQSTNLADNTDVNPTSIPSTVLNSPSSLSPAELAKASTDVRYSDPEKEVLRKLSEARQAYDDLQSISKVTKDIHQGSTESKALMEYLDDAGKAKTTNNERLMTTTLNGISMFAKSHASKLDHAMQAMELSKVSGKPVQIFRTSNGWAINDSGKPFTKAERRANGALDISVNRSERLIAGIAQEVDAIAKTKDAVETVANRKANANLLTDLDSAIESLLTNAKAESLSAQDLADQGKAEVKAKAKAKPVNTPVDPTENNWEGMTVEPNTTEVTQTDPVTEQNVSDAIVTEEQEAEQPKPQPIKPKAKKVEQDTIHNLVDVVDVLTSNTKQDKTPETTKALIDAHLRYRPDARILITDDVNKIPKKYRQPNMENILSDARAHDDGTIVLYKIKDALAHHDLSINEVLAHELGHLTTLQTINDPKHPHAKEIAKELNAIRSFLTEHLKTADIADDVRGRIEYMVKSKAEIVTIGTAEPKVIEELKKIKQEGEHKNLFLRVVGLYKKIFGLTDSVSNLAERIQALADTIAAVQDANVKVEVASTTESVTPIEEVLTTSSEEVLSVEDILEEFTGLDSSIDYDPTYSTKVEANKELLAKRELEKELAFADRNLITDAVMSAATPISLRHTAYTEAFANQPLATIQKTLLNDVREAHGKDLEPQQEAAVKELGVMFFNMSKDNSAVLLNGYASDVPNYKNYAKYLLASTEMRGKNEVGILDPKVQDAITIAAYSWIAENGQTLSSKEDVLKSLFFTDAYKLPSHVYNNLKDIGTYKNNAAQSLGAKAIEVLGYQFASDVSPERKDKLAVALGHLGIHAMIRMNYLNEVSLQSNLITTYVDQIRSANEDAKISFEDGQELPKQLHYVQIPSDKEFNPKGNSQRVLNANRGSKSIINKTFGVPNHTTPIRMSAPKEMQQTTIDQLGTEIPSYQVEAINGNAHKLKWTISKGIHKIHTKLSSYPELRGQMYGIVSEEKIANTQAMLREGIRTNNQAINWDIQAYEESLDLLGDTKFGIDQNFYLQQEVWNQQRSGMKNVLNPVSSKLHRGLVSLREHEVEVAINKEFVKGILNGNYEALYNEDGSISELGEFLQILALGSEDLKPTGVTTTADKTQLENYAPQYVAWMFGDGRPVLASVAKLMGDGDVQEKDVQRVADAVSAMGMNAVSLKTLVSMSNFVTAVTKGESSFKSDLSLEIDGVTNGPFLTQMMMNTLNKRLAGAGGLYTEADGITNVPQYKDAKHDDMYEHNAKLLDKAINTVIKTTQESTKLSDKAKAETINVINNVKALHPNFTERKGAKTLTTVINFASGGRASAQGVAGDVLDSIIKLLGSVKQGSPAHVSVVASLNSILGGSTVTTTAIDVKTDPLELEFTYDQEKALLVALQRPLQEIVKEFTATAYPEYVEVRDEFTALSNLGYELFSPLYADAIKQAEEADLVDGQASIEGISKDALRELHKELRSVMPSYVTAMGLRSDNADASSIPMVKSSKRLDKSERRMNDLYMTGSRKVEERNISNTGKLGKYSKESATAHIEQGTKYTFVEAPGVRNTPMAIHSQDSFIAHSALGKFATMNVHDALTSKVGQGRELAKFLNKTTLDSLIDVDLNVNFITGALKPLKGLASDAAVLTEQQSHYVDALLNVAKTLNLDEQNASYTDLVNTLLPKAFGRDKAKLLGLKEYSYLNQYGLEGGEYKFTSEDYARIDKRIAELETKEAEVTKELTALALQVDLALDLTPNTVIPADTKVEDAVEVKVESKVDMATVDFYLKNVDGPVNKKVLFSAIAHDVNRANVNNNLAVLLAGQMFNLVKEALPDQLDIQIADSKSPNYYEHIAKGEFGWINLNVDGKPVIYMLKDQDGNFDTATLLHELLHAATAVAIRTKTPKAQKAVEELETLRKQFANYVAVSKISDSKVDYALSNLDEFIATVFSEPKVANLLNQMRIPRSQVSGLKGFIRMISNLVASVFGKPTPKLNTSEVTGLEALISGVMTLAKSTDSSTAYNLYEINAEELNSPKRRAVDSVKRMKTFEVMGELLGTGTIFDDQVATLIDNFALPILDRMDDAFLNTLGLSSDPTSVWVDAINNNATTTQDKAVLSGYRMSEKERFATELIYVATKGAQTDRGLSLSYSELTKTFNKARSVITPESFVKGSWNNASQAERDTAQAKWDYIFKVTTEGDHIARFTSMVLANAEVNNAARVTASKAVNTKEGILAVAERFITETIERIGQFFVGAKPNQNIANHVYDLTKALAKVDLKNRNFITNKIEEQISRVDTYADELVVKAKNQIRKAVKKSKLQDSKNAVVGLAADVVNSASQDRLWNDLQVYRDYMNNHKGKLGFWRELVNEFAENSPFKSIVEKLKRQVTLTSQRKELMKEQTIKTVINAFKDGGKHLTKESNEAITMMLRADVQALVSNYSTSDIAKLYTNGSYRNAQIAKYAQQLRSLDPEASVMISRAKDLARYMITGLGAKNNDLATNAMLIAMRAGTAKKVGQDQVNPSTVEAIDTLVSLYAIQYTNANTKTELEKVFDTELGNAENGIDTVLKLHKYLADDAKATLFTENPLSVTKGYVPEITNPNHEVRFATSEIEARNLKEQFFREVKTLEPNVLSNGQTVRMFVSEDAGLTRLVSGTLELVSSNPKGTPVSIDNLPNTVSAIYAKQSAKRDTKYDPYDKAEGSAMIPRYDLEGNIIGFNYQMSSATRDALLQRNNNFADILGQYTATNYNKQSVPANNELAIDAIVMQYNKHHDKNPRGYIEVSPTSSDSELRTMWQMLPQATRDYIRQEMGASKLVVPKEAVLPLFGYKKYSVINGFDKSKSESNLYERVYTAVFKLLFGNNARVYAARTERGMQEAVSLAKNIIVIRNVRTLTMNILSNTFLLQAHGVSLTNIVKDTVVALRAGMQHRKDSAQLIAAQQQLYAGVGDKNKLEQEVMRLSQAVASNPLSEFINEGMLPSIVDDVAMHADSDYNFKSALERKFDKQINKIPQSMRIVASWLMVSPKTPLYELLNNTTQLSDFTAKYVLYKHYSKDAPTKDRVSHDKAIQIASDNFVNYDIPTSKGMQYLNDMGIVMFTKYNLRIQKALFRLLERKPARALLQALVMHHGTDIPFGIDPIVWNQIGFPLRDGALILPDALGEPLPISMLGKLF